MLRIGNLKRYSLRKGEMMEQRVVRTDNPAIDLQVGNSSCERLTTRFRFALMRTAGRYRRLPTRVSNRSVR